MRDQELRGLTRHRWIVAISLTAAMMFIYFGFMLLVAYRKDWLGAEITPGLGRGVLLGAGVILSAWLLTFIYTVWANKIYDPRVRAIRDGKEQ